MIKVNCEHFEEPIVINSENFTIVSIEDTQIFSKVIYSLYNREDGYFKIFDDSFKDVKDKDIIIIFNPLTIDFEDKSIKGLLYARIIDILNNNLESKQLLENKYQKIIIQLAEIVEYGIDIDISFQESLDFKELLKFMKLTIDQSVEKSIFDKVQSILKVLNELGSDKLIIFCHLSIFVSVKSIILCKSFDTMLTLK